MTGLQVGVGDVAVGERRLAGRPSPGPRTEEERLPRRMIRFDQSESTDPFDQSESTDPIERRAAWWAVGGSGGAGEVGADPAGEGLDDARGGGKGRGCGEGRGRGVNRVEDALLAVAVGGGLAQPAARRAALVAVMLQDLPGRGGGGRR